MERLCPWGREHVPLDPNELKPDEKEWLGWALSNKKYTNKELQLRFGLSKHTLKKYVSKFKKGLKIGSVGRRRVLAKEDEKEYLQFINEHHQRNHSPDAAKRKLREIQLNIARQLGIAELNVPMPSIRSIDRINESLDCHVNNAEESTTCAQKSDLIGTLVISLQK